MELLLEHRVGVNIKVKKIFYLSFISLLVSSIELFDSSMMFVLPLFFLCFECGYEEVVGYFIGIVISYFIFHISIYSLFISFGLFIALMICMRVKAIKLAYIPYFIGVISFIYYYIFNDLYVALLLSFITLINMKVISLLPPLIIHGSQVLTSERIRALNIVVFITMSALLPYSTLISFIFMRLYILILLIYIEIDDIIPSLFYASLIMLFSNIHYQSDVISLLLPLFIYYIVEAKTKMMIILLYLCSHLILPFFIDYSFNYHTMMILIPAVIFMFIPFNEKRTVSKAYQEVTMQNQLIKQVDSFTELFHSMTTLFNETSLSTHAYEYVGYIYEDLCKDCSSHDQCFSQRYGPNRLVKLMNKGLKHSYSKDDKLFIENYCLEPELYFDLVKTYRGDYEKIKRIRMEYQSMKKELYKQFNLLLEVFNNFSYKLKVGNIEEKHIIEHLKGYHFDIEYLKKYFESTYVYYIEIGLYNTNKKEVIRELIPILEAYLNENLELTKIKEPMHHLGYTYVLLKHCSRYSVLYGVSQYSHDPLACGDSYNLFNVLSKQYFALSDGMGQGVKASEESKLTLKILKQLMCNGVSLKSALQSVNALLKIKNRNDMFTTLDMIEIDLTNANATFIKYGCLETYILRNNELIKIETKALPIGIVPSIDLTIEKTKLMENDIIFMFTDGYGKDFKELLEDSKLFFEEDHPTEIATFVMNRAMEDEMSDDLSLIVLKIIKQR